MDNTPYSEISEIAVLGTMISFPETIRLYIEKDFPLDVFFNEDNKRVAKVLLQVYKERGIVEYQMILDKFASVTHNEKPANCPDYLMNLIQNATTKSTFGYYLNIIEEKYRVRSLVEKSREIIHLASQPIDDVDEFLFEVEQDVLGLTRTSNSNDMRTSESIVQEALNNFNKAMQNDGSVTGLKTGFRELDKVTNGLQDGDLIILGARPSVGKGHPHWIELPTPSGSVKVGDIKVGDYVFDRYGKPTKVTGVYPRGKLETYKVTLNDGRSTIVDGDHIWSHFMLSGCGNESLIDKTTSYMFEQGVRSKSNRAKYSIPTNEAVEFAEKEHQVDPYVIGSLIGDGCLLESRLTFSSGDRYVVEKIGSLIGFKPKFTISDNFNWLFQKTDGTNVKTKELLKEFDEMRVYSYLKQIPKEYLVDSYENRMKLLNGLFDTDGCATSKGRKLMVSYSTTSEKLKDQVVWLLRSCGYITGLAVDKREGRRDCYDIRVLADSIETKKLFTLKRKRDVIVNSERIVQRKYDRIGISSIEKTGVVEEITCISVDNKEQLYLANDFIVTHNTAFALNLGLNVARLNDDAKSVVAIFSLEMAATQLINRLTSTVSTVPNYKIRDGKVNQDEFNNINKAYSTIQSLNLYVDDDGSITVPDIFKKCRSLKDEQGLDVVIIDYMQLINSKQQGQNRQAEISVISRQMKQLAREMNVPVIALSQLSRKLEQREDKTPILSDLRESGSIEQDADIVMFLHRDDYGKTDDELDGFNSNISETLLRVAKNRNGSLKDIDLAFEKNTGKFTDVEYTKYN